MRSPGLYEFFLFILDIMFVCQIEAGSLISVSSVGIKKLIVKV